MRPVGRLWNQVCSGGNEKFPSVILNPLTCPCLLTLFRPRRLYVSRQLLLDVQAAYISYIDPRRHCCNCLLCHRLHWSRELLKALGVTSLIVDDLYSLDDESVASLKPVHAFIFLFKWVGSSGDERGGASGSYDHDFTGFFANQARCFFNFGPTLCLS